VSKTGLDLPFSSHKSQCAMLLNADVRKALIFSRATSTGLIWSVLVTLGALQKASADRCNVIDRCAFSRKQRKDQREIEIKPEFGCSVLRDMARGALQPVVFACEGPKLEILSRHQGQNNGRP
jgi:hypothetical protein